MKNKLTFFIIYEHTFGASTHVFIGPRDLYVKKASKMFGAPEDAVAPGPNMIGMYHTAELVCGKTGIVKKSYNLLWLEKFNGTPACYSTMSHEISHLVDRTLECKNIPTGIESTEVRAYLTGFFTGEFFRQLKKARKK